MKKLYAIALLFAVLPFTAQAAFGYGTKYEITLTNGGYMPVSPGVLYSIVGQDPSSAVGSAATDGFVQLCQSGNPDGKFAELSSDGKIKSLVKTDGPILPGQSLTTEIEVPHRHYVSVHFEAMYGKSKDACSVVSIGSDDLVRAASIPHFSATGLDSVVVTGAFQVPALANGGGETACAEATNAIACLRALSNPLEERQVVSYFPGYLPSLTTFLESRYGAEDVSTLAIPQSGALRYSIKRK